MDIKLVKYVINGANFVKIAHFGENAQNRVILAYYGGKMTLYVNIFGKWSNNFIPKKFLKINQVYGQKSGEKCH